MTLVHGTDMSELAWRCIADSGANVTLAPTSDEQLGLADGVPPAQRAVDLGIRLSLSMDVEISLSSDMFSQMSCVLLTQRIARDAAPVPRGHVRAAVHQPPRRARVRHGRRCR